MPFLSFIARLIIGTISQPGVRDVISNIGKYAIRQATISVVRQIRNRSVVNRSVPTIH